MKVLIVGAGLVGLVYGWLLSEAGHEVRFLSWRPLGDSIVLHGVDRRGRQRGAFRASHAPQWVVGGEPKDRYDLIIVTVGSHRLMNALAALARVPDAGDVLCLQSLWQSREYLAHLLGADRFVLGFPSVSGVRDAEGIAVCSSPGRRWVSRVAREARGSAVWPGSSRRQASSQS